MKKLNLRVGGQYCAGLGDAVLWAWIANGPEPLEFYCEGRLAEMFALLGCRVTDDPEGAIDPGGAYNLELNERGRRLRVEIWCEFLQIPCVVQRPRVQIECGGYMRRRVALCPQTNWRARAWPPGYWIDLSWELRKANLEPVWMLSEMDQRLVDAGGPTMGYYGYSLKQAAEMYASAAVVVGNDSMPAHLAGTIGVPTIAICGPTNANCVFGHIDNVIPFVAEDLDCVGCHFGKPFRVACDWGCQALNRVSPQEVSKTIVHIIERVIHGGTQRGVLGGVSA